MAITASDTGLHPGADWATTTTTAVWQHGDWKVDRVELYVRARSQRAGTSSASAAFIDALAGMRTLRHAP